MTKKKKEDKRTGRDVNADAEGYRGSKEVVLVDCVSALQSDGWIRQYVELGDSSRIVAY